MLILNVDSFNWSAVPADDVPVKVNRELECLLNRVFSSKSDGVWDANKVSSNYYPSIVQAVITKSNPEGDPNHVRLDVHATGNGAWREMQGMDDWNLHVDYLIHTDVVDGTAYSWRLVDDGTGQAIINHHGASKGRIESLWFDDSIDGFLPWDGEHSCYDSAGLGWMIECITIMLEESEYKPRALQSMLEALCLDDRAVEHRLVMER